MSAQLDRRVARAHFGAWRAWHDRVAALRTRAASTRAHELRTRCLFRLQIHAAQEQARASTVIASAARLRATRRALRTVFDALYARVAAREGALRAAEARAAAKRAGALRTALRAWRNAGAAARRFRAFHTLSRTRHCFVHWHAVLPALARERQRVAALVESWARATDRVWFKRWRAGVRSVLIEKRVRALHYVRLLAKRWKSAAFARWRGSSRTFAQLRARFTRARVLRCKVTALLRWRAEAAQSGAARRALQREARAYSLRSGVARWAAHARRTRTRRGAHAEARQRRRDARLRSTLTRWTAFARRSHALLIAHVAATRKAREYGLRMGLARWAAHAPRARALRESFETLRTAALVMLGANTRAWVLGRWRAYLGFEKKLVAAMNVLRLRRVKTTLEAWGARAQRLRARRDARTAAQRQRSVRRRRAALARWAARARRLHTARAQRADQNIAARALARTHRCARAATQWRRAARHAVAVRFDSARRHHPRNRAFAAWRAWGVQQALRHAQCAQAICEGVQRRRARGAFDALRAAARDAARQRTVIRLMESNAPGATHCFAVWRAAARRVVSTRQRLSRVDALAARARDVSLQWAALRALGAARAALARAAAAAAPLAARRAARCDRALVANTLHAWSRWTLVACTYARASEARRAQQCFRGWQKWTLVACRFAERPAARAQRTRHCVGVWKKWTLLACRFDRERTSRRAQRYLQCWHRWALVCSFERTAAARRCVDAWRLHRAARSAQRTLAGRCFARWHSLLHRKLALERGQAHIAAVLRSWTAADTADRFNRWRSFVERKRNTWIAWRLFILDAQCIELAREYGAVTTPSVESSVLRAHFANWRTCARVGLRARAARRGAAAGALPSAQGGHRRSSRSSFAAPAPLPAAAPLAARGRRRQPGRPGRARSTVS